MNDDLASLYRDFPRDLAGIVEELLLQSSIQSMTPENAAILTSVLPRQSAAERDRLIDLVAAPLAATGDLCSLQQILQMRSRGVPKKLFRAVAFSAAANARAEIVEWVFCQTPVRFSMDELDDLLILSQQQPKVRTFIYKIIQAQAVEAAARGDYDFVEWAHETVPRFSKDIVKQMYSAAKRGRHADLINFIYQNMM